MGGHIFGRFSLPLNFPTKDQKQATNLNKPNCAFQSSIVTIWLTVDLLHTQTAAFNVAEAPVGVFEGHEK